MPRMRERDDGVSMLDSLICDYNYKCLDSKTCPHDTSCTLKETLTKIIKRRYHNISYQKNKKGWNHENVSKHDLRCLFSESLRSGFKCPYCQSDMTLEPDFTNTATIDHVTARSLGGDNDKKNMVLCCRDCNTKKAKIELPFVMEKNRGII